MPKDDVKDNMSYNSYLWFNEVFKMKKLKSRNWKDEINALLISRHIKKIRQMSIGYLRELLKEAMDIGYGFQQEENLTKHNSSSKKDCYNPICAKRSHECLSLEYSVCNRRKRSPS